MFPQSDNQNVDSNRSSSSFLRSLNPLTLHHLHNSSFDDSTTTAAAATTNHRALVSREVNKIEREIIRLITAGSTETLKPNSGQAVAIDGNYVCISCRKEEAESEYRVWEWHGHVVSYDEESGYTQDYVCGNYFERLMTNKVRYSSSIDEENEEGGEKSFGVGLRGLIGGLGSKWVG